MAGRGSSFLVFTHLKIILNIGIFFGVFAFCLLQTRSLARAFQTEVLWQFNLAKIEGPLPLWKLERVLRGRPRAGPRPRVHPWRLALRAAVGHCSRGPAEAGRRVRSRTPAARCSEPTTGGKVHSVHEPLAILSGCRK